MHIASPRSPPSPTWAEPGAAPLGHLWAEPPLQSTLGHALPVSSLVGAGAPLRFKRLPSPPYPRAAAAEEAQRLARPGAFDGPVVGLRAATLHNGTLHGTLGVGRWSTARALEGGPRLSPSGRLPPLRHSVRLNDIGIIVLVVDPDDRVWVARRARGMGLRGGRWSATASGGLEPSDGPAVGTWTETHLGNAALRELQEETGLGPASVGPPALLGLVREWRRGGKPEATFLVRARRPLPAARLRPSAEISLLRAIPIKRLQADHRLWAEADLTLRLSVSLLLDLLLDARA